MLGDAVKRLEYIVQHRPEEPLAYASGAATAAYWVLFHTTQIMLAAIGANALARELDNSPRHPVDLFQVLREHGIKKTPYDKLIQWTYNVVRAEYYTGDRVDIIDGLQARATEIMQWQAATRTDINKLSIDQVFAAVDEWAAPRAEETVYEFPNGWTIKKLVGPAALVREGELMHHCVKEPQYAKAVAAGEKVIYSLRNPNNKPHVTLDWNPGDRRFTQMMMAWDKYPPSEEYLPMLMEFVIQAHGGTIKDGETIKDLLLTGTRADELNLRGADLPGVNLRRADLTGADLAGAYLAGANLTSANLTSAVLTDAILNGAVLGYADLTGAVLTDAVLYNADLIGADLRSANLTGADLTSADLTSAKLGRASLTGADLTNADLSGANLFDAHLNSAVLARAKLVDAKLTGADLTGADLTGADLTGADLTGVIFDEYTMLPDGTHWSPPAGLGYYDRRRR